MINVVVVSYLSKEREGRLKRLFFRLSKEEELNVELVQGCFDVSECSEEENVSNIVLLGKSNLQKYLFFVKKAKKLLRKKDYDYIFLENYYTALLTYGLDKKKIIYDSYELYFPGCGKKMSLRDYLFYLCEKRAVQRSKMVIATNTERALIMMGAFHISKLPLVISNAPLSVANNATGETRNNRIVYVGYLSPERQLNRLIDAVGQYNVWHDNSLQLDIYGQGDLQVEIERIASENPCVHYFGQYKNHQLPDILNKYKYGYIAYDNSEVNTLFCAPNKLYDYVSCDNVIVGNDNYSLKKVITSFSIGAASSDLVRNIEEVVENYNIYYRNIQKMKSEYSVNDDYREMIRMLREVSDGR